MDISTNKIFRWIDLTVLTSSCLFIFPLQNTSSCISVRRECSRTVLPSVPVNGQIGSVHKFILLWCDCYMWRWCIGLGVMSSRVLSIYVIEKLSHAFLIFLDFLFVFEVHWWLWCSMCYPVIPYLNHDYVSVCAFRFKENPEKKKTKHCNVFLQCWRQNYRNL